MKAESKCPKTGVKKGVFGLFCPSAFVNSPTLSSSPGFPKREKRAIYESQKKPNARHLNSLSLPSFSEKAFFFTDFCFITSPSPTPFNKDRFPCSSAASFSILYKIFFLVLLLTLFFLFSVYALSLSFSLTLRLLDTLNNEVRG